MKNPRYRVYKSNIDKLIELYPHIFDKKVPKPLSIGFFQELCMDVRDNDYNLSNSVLQAALAIWTNRFEYLREIIKPDSARYHLNGVIQGSVSDDNRRAAIRQQHKNRLASKRARRKRIQLEEERLNEIDKAALRCIIRREND